MEKEFNIGDIVTFQPFTGNKPIKGVVREIFKGAGKNGMSIFGNYKDERIFYRLEGHTKPLITECNGTSIIESKYFNPSKEN